MKLAVLLVICIAVISLTESKRRRKNKGGNKGSQNKNEGILGTIRADVSKVKVDVERIIGIVNGTQNDVVSIKANVAEVKNEVGGMKGIVTETQETVETIRADVLEVKNGVMGLRSSVDETENGVSEVKEDVHELGSRIEKLEADLERRLSEIISLISEILKADKTTSTQKTTSTLKTTPTPKITSTTKSSDTGLGCGGSTISSIGNKVVVKSGQGTHGWWFIDPIDSTAWVMRAYTDVNRLERYADEVPLSGSPIETIVLGVKCDGTGHVMYAGYFYCNVAGTNRVAKIKVANNQNVGEVILSDAGFRNTFHYQWGGYSDIDLSVDNGNRLYAIYGSKRNGGNYAIAQLDIDTLGIVNTWQIHVKKGGTGNSFIANRMLYILDSYHRPSQFTYRYDMEKGILVSLDSGVNKRLSYPGPSSSRYLTAMEFLPKRCQLLIWDNGDLMKMNLAF